MFITGKLDKSANIKLVSLGGNSACLLGSKAITITDEQGNYRMDIIDGSYAVEIMYDSEYIYKGVLTVTGEEATLPF